jgi:tetratricopeptide (TPR) repeat protein
VAPSRPLPRWKVWLFRGLLAVGVPAVGLVALELGLRLAGYGYPTGFWLKSGDGGAFVVNEHFTRQFYATAAAATKPHPVLLPAKKAEDTLRIFILGESAAQGVPNPSFGFARILEVMLRSQYPRRRFEVINAAVRGINSHVVLPIARACAAQQPDLFILYLGNNEVVGLHAPGPGTGFLNRSLVLLRASQRLRGTRVGQWLTSLREASRRPEEQDMNFFRARRIALDDPRRQRVYRHFSANLDEICAITAATGAKVLLSTVAVNLKDFPPIASVHRLDLTEADLKEWETAYERGTAAEIAGEWNRALEAYRAAARLDDHFAELHFRMARCFFARDEFKSAAKHFALARDWDALPFRADSAINEAIRATAARYAGRGLELFDAERALAASDLSEHGLPGDKVFYEHVHLRFDGDYALARALMPAVTNALAGRLGTPADTPLPTRQQCAERLAFTPWDELQADISMVKMTANPPFLDQLDHAHRQSRADQEQRERLKQFTPARLQEMVALYQAALARNPEDWQLHHNFGIFWFFNGNYESAARYLEYEVKVFPGLAENRMPLSAALARAGRRYDARERLREALRIDPRFNSAREALRHLETGGATR